MAMYFFGKRTVVFRVLLIVFLGSMSVISINFYIPGPPYIRCVQCTSDESPSCIDNPPDPLGCFKRERHCQVVKTTSSTNGSVIAVFRGCWRNDAPESASECSTDAEGSVTVCTSTCDLSGCNRSSDDLCPSMTLLIFVLLVFRWSMWEWEWEGSAS